MSTAVYEKQYNIDYIKEQLLYIEDDKLLDFKLKALRDQYVDQLTVAKFQKIKNPNKKCTIL